MLKFPALALTAVEYLKKVDERGGQRIFAQQHQGAKLPTNGAKLRLIDDSSDVLFLLILVATVVLVATIPSRGKFSDNDTSDLIVKPAYSLKQAQQHTYLVH